MLHKNENKMFRMITQKKIKIVLSIFISLGFTFLVLRGVDLKKTSELIFNVKYGYLFLAFVAVILGQLLRSVRWGFILYPIQPMSQRFLFPITSIGFMFVVLLPARLGELARPYLLNKNSQIKISTSLATILLERMLDMFFMLIFAGWIVKVFDLPNWFVQGITIILAIFGLMTLLLFLGNMKFILEAFMKFINKFLPVRLADFFENKVENFYQGLTVLGDKRYLLISSFLTFLIWCVFILVNYFLLKAVSIDLGIFAALTILTLTALGISIPAGPGFIGNFHFFCILGLSLFGVDREIALSYAILNHVLIVGTFLLLGIVSINISKLKIGFKALKSSEAISPEIP